MNVQIMVTVSGSDKTDLIKVLSEKTHLLGGKWLNSKITHIDTYFAGLLKIEIASEQVEKLTADFKGLAINVDVAVLAATTEQKLSPFNLSIDAKDRPGLVNDISQVLSENSIHVEHMECHRLGGADISGTLFTARFNIAVADNFNQELLLNSLQKISPDLAITLKAQA